jgi:NAD(P)-dependent dehydrogenase (short-subunit alcohol dehydrogenase family)
MPKRAEQKSAVYPEVAGKVALVTGGSSGIGFATARAFARQGAKVVIASRTQAHGEKAAQELARAGAVRYVAADAGDAKSVKRLFDDISRAEGRLDYAFNNGGSGGRFAPIGKMSEEAWRKTLDGYLTSVFLCMTAEIAAMGAGGVIVNNASVDGLRGYPFPGGAAYSAAKHGVVGLTRSAALECAKSGPRIAAICPGWIDTPPVANYMRGSEARTAEILRQTPRGKIGHPDEIAAAVLWLCSTGASFAVGTILAVDGGYMA